MAITPLDIQQQRFRTRMGGGLDKSEVDAFLNAVAAEVERLIRECNELKDETRTSRRLLDDHRAREEALTQTMITAQRVTDEIKKGADKEADIIIGRAELEAERIQEHAIQRRSELLMDIAELKRQRAQLIGQLRGTLLTHQKLLEVAEQEDHTPRVEDLAVMRARPQAARPAAPAPVADTDPTRARGG